MARLTRPSQGGSMLRHLVHLLDVGAAFGEVASKLSDGRICFGDRIALNGQHRPGN